MWPDSVGKDIGEYLEGAVSPIVQTEFKVRLLTFLRENGSGLKLNDENVQVLFEISDGYGRRLNAIAQMEKDSLARDWSRRKTLIKSLERQLTKLIRGLDKKSSQNQFPNTALLASSIVRKLKTLARELALVQHHQRAGEAMLRMLSLKQFQNECVGQIDYYIAHSFPESPQGERDILLAATMVAARLTSLRNHANLIADIPVMRSRANQSIEDDGAVYQTKPRKHMTSH